MINFEQIIHELTFLFFFLLAGCLPNWDTFRRQHPFGWQCTHLCEKPAKCLFDSALLLPHHSDGSSQRIEIEFIGHPKTKMKQHGALSHFSSLPRLSTPAINIQSENANATDYRANISSSTIQSHLLFINE